MQYINAEKLKAEIERLKDFYHERGRGCDNAIEEALDDMLPIITSLQKEQPEVDLEEYISAKLRVLGADLINHKPYSFNRGVNVGMTKAYDDILTIIKARKEE